MLYLSWISLLVCAITEALIHNTQAGAKAARVGMSHSNRELTAKRSANPGGAQVVSPAGLPAPQVPSVDLLLAFFLSNEDRSNGTFFSWLLFEAPLLLPMLPPHPQCVTAPGKWCLANLTFKLAQAVLQGTAAL